MSRLRLVLLVILVPMALALVVPPGAAAAPTLALNPPSGNAPSVSGTIGGSGWLCGSGAVPVGGATVSGAGVTGSASINRDGTLGGSFTVRGTAGQSIEVKVTADAACPSTRPPVNLQATAIFTFNAPTATPTSTPTTVPTATPTAVPTATPQPAPTATATPTPEPTLIPTPTATTAPAATPTPTATLEPAPAATATSTATPMPTPSPAPAAARESTPTATAEPPPSPTPTATLEPEVTPTPTAGLEPVLTPTATPPAGASPAPTAAATSGPTQQPSATPTGRTVPPVEATATPTKMPAASPTAAPKPALASAPATITLIGCTPSAGKVQARFDPVQADPATPSFTVPAVQAPGQPGTFALDVSPARAGAAYKVLALTDDPACGPELGPARQAFWLPGRGLSITFVVAGTTELWTNPTTIASGEMLSWMKEGNRYGYDSAKKVPFKVATELKGAQAVKLQASYFPMPTDASADLLSPPGLLATWDAAQTCGSQCTFSLDISQLLPSPAQKNWAQEGLDSVKTFFTAIGDGAKKAGQFVINLVQIGGGQKSPEVAKLDEVTLLPPSKTSLGSYMASTGLVGLPTTFYFRAVVLDKDGKPAGNPSNSVKINWSAEANPNPTGPDFKLPSPPPAKPVANWSFELLSYHGLLRPQISDSCFIVTADSQGNWTPNHLHANQAQDTDLGHLASGAMPYSGDHPYYKGDIVCQPAPPDDCGWSDLGACIGDIVGFFEDAVNWVSEVYSEAKGAAVGFVAEGLGAIPGVSDICSQSCLEGGLTVGLDVALTSVGIPPNIPNFADLENQGLDYLAEQAVAAAGAKLPAGTLEAAQAAGLDPKEEIKKGIKQGLAEAEKAYADSVNWLPEGVPVRPDGPQPAGVVLKVTRSKNDPPGDCSGGYVAVDAFAKMSGDFPGYKPYHPSYLPADIKTLDLVAGGTYRVFKPKSVQLPCAAPGTSLVIPVMLEPYQPHVGLHPPDTAYFWWLYPYALSGELRVEASGSPQVKYNFVPNDPKW